MNFSMMICAAARTTALVPCSELTERGHIHARKHAVGERLAQRGRERDILPVGELREPIQYKGAGSLADVPAGNRNNIAHSKCLQAAKRRPNICLQSTKLRIMRA